MVEIWDCRRKEKLVTRRISGDFEIAILDENGNVKTKYWFQMKKPYDKTASMLEDLFKVIKSYLERQEEG